MDDLKEENDKLKAENAQLRITIKSLRQQLEAYKSHNRRQYEFDMDYLPYHEREE